MAKIGTAEVATDPMPPNISDSLIIVKPRSEWPDPSRSKADLVAAIEKRLEQIPGNAYEFAQPIQMRFNELISGVRSDVGIKVFGDDLDTLLSIADRIRTVVEAIPGAADARTEQVGGLPMLTVKPDRTALVALSHHPRRRSSRLLSLSPSAARRPDSSSRATGASTSSCACPSICASTSMRLRNYPIPACRRSPVNDPHRRLVLQTTAARRPCLMCRCRNFVATLEVAPGPNQISREDGKRPHRRHGQCARARPRLVRPRGPAPRGGESEAAARRLDHLGRPVRAARRRD